PTLARLQGRDRRSLGAAVGDVAGDAGSSGGEGGFAHDVVAIEDGARFLGGHLHWHALRDSGADEISHCGTPHVVEATTLHPGGNAGTTPRLPEVANGKAVAVEDERAVEAALSRTADDDVEEIARQDQDTRPAGLRVDAAQADHATDDVAIAAIQREVAPLQA